MKDEDLIIFNKGIKEGQKHSEPSYKTQKFMEETRDCLNNLKLDQELMKNDLKNICTNNDTQHEEIKKMILSLQETVTVFIESSDVRFASKKFQRVVEKILWGMAIFVAGVIGTALFDLIIK